MRVRTATQVATLLATLTVMPTIAQTAPRTTLTALRDTARPLLIFAGNNDMRAQQQFDDLSSHSGELRARDMRVIVIDAMPHPERDRSPLPLASFAPEEEAYARQQFHVGLNDFAVVLLGKDGGEKLRSSSPIPWQKLASTVDGMPMRKDEVKRQR